MASSRIIACVVLLAALVCGATGDAQQPVPSEQQDRHERDQQVPPADRPPPPPVFRVGINFVRVDVIVTDRTGRAVADLQPGDFEIIEEGKPQKIETFRYIELNGGLTQDAPSRAIRTDADEEAEAARDDVRAVRDVSGRLSRAAGVESREPPGARAVRRDPALGPPIWSR